MLKIDERHRWYPIYTKPRFEKKVAENLLKQGIEVYLPSQKILKQWSDRKKWVDEPLFKSYVFIHINYLQYDQVVRTPGVVRFIYFSGKIASVPDMEMNFLQTYLSGDFTVETTGQFIKSGDKVKIVSGKFKGYEAEMVSYQNEKRLILRIDALGQSILLNIPVADVISK
ncbi:NusG antitermination factor [Pseudopedobacter saltans DSM 12145]|uniref:NusG antitermination factor n=1 Tax=Pseudopedobacter saltans (strain ATCC 51119 / DSM 12145 / JCM 21818 / CCUG 39354 / LMG 10337 / NBRC 100064 / NCIMB 13643) TaxID=762903 RepID=F0SD62_PSESL|nr:UpxY family transcription antiterminator [Pseudopedobacter saltans]ADY52848.1 NusG antitermination factor [Pseudopedobacter saltans DSM 12145]